jgi:hypothetical protein
MTRISGVVVMFIKPIASMLRLYGSAGHICDPRKPAVAFSARVDIVY